RDRRLRAEAPPQARPPGPGLRDPDPARGGLPAGDGGTGNLVPLTIRARLTLWYTTVLLAALLLFAAWIYVVEARLRLEDVDAELRRAGTAVAAAVDAEMDEEAGPPATA